MLTPIGSPPSELMKSFKKFTLVALAAITLSGSLSSCATVFGGRVTEQQKRKPIPGEQQRQVRVGALIADIILFWPGTIVDFATGATSTNHSPL